MMFLPQRPYFTQGSLRDQITMPDRLGNEVDEALLEILQTVGLYKDLDLALGASVKKGGDEVEEIESGRFWGCSCDGNINVDEGAEHRFMDTKGNWYVTLTPGQQQLLSFARVLYHKPQILLMDEATSAVNCKDLFYSELQKLGVVYLSVSHDETLDRYHDQVIRLKSDGKLGWTFTKQ